MSIFANHLLSYSPVVNSKKLTTATRLSVLRIDNQPCNVSTVYQEIATACVDCPDTILLSIDYNEPSDVLWGLGSSERLWLEVPGSILESADGREWVNGLARHGFKLVLRNYPGQPASPDVLSHFQFAIVDTTQDRRNEAGEASPEQRQISTAISGITTIADMERAFTSGATSIIGWPLDDALDRGKPPGSASSFTAVSRLLSLINSGGSADDMENVLATDPTLAFRLFRYLNSPAFGLTVEIRSFEHAMMMLGQKRMKKWLSLLLATASPDPNLNTLMFASVRRGFLMEKLVSEFHEKQVQDEAFIIGVFSMLDKLFCEPFEKLFERLQISDSVYEALVSGTGPSMPYLNLATALEHSPDQISEAQDNAFITPSSCNTMLLSTLTEAAQAQQAT